MAAVVEVRGDGLRWSRESAVRGRTAHFVLRAIALGAGTVGAVTTPAATEDVAPHAHRVAIVGAGFAGTMVAVHLLQAGVAVEVVLIERGGRFGVGLAYGTHAPEHLLNVPAADMSPFPDRPTAFVEWLRNRTLGVVSGVFARRRDYGEFLQETLADAASQGSGHGAVLRRVVGEAIDLEPKEDGVEVALASGEPLPADAVVLATGNLPARDPLEPLRSSIPPDHYREAWRADALDGIAADDPVLLLGTGLTAVDLILSLRRRGHVGRTVALSRRGLLPQGHQPFPPMASGFQAQNLREAGTVRRLFQDLRRAAEAEESLGGDWRSVIGAMRPHTPAIWAALPRVERERFLRHVRPFWDTHRHRMAPEVADSIDTLLAIDAIEVRAGRVTGVHQDGGLMRVSWCPRGMDLPQELEAARIINATGPSPDLRGRTTRLFEALRERGLILPDRLGLGLDTTEEGTVIGRDGVASERVFALGVLRSGGLWETTAVPEIRVQAKNAAARVLCAPL